MTLKIIGAGVGRTATSSLKNALETLMGAPCYHMSELSKNDNHDELWYRAARGELDDWNEIMEGYVAAVDWPAASFWPELSRAYPEAKIVLSTRDPEAWWKSASATIFPSSLKSEGTWRDMWDELRRTRFTDQIEDKDAALAAYNAHVANVYATAPPDRLVEWQPSDGWEPLCLALDLPIPDEPFPHKNSTADFNARREED
jgi:hypothetical protein